MEISFKKFLESKDIFGFERAAQKNSEDGIDPILNNPINQFDPELLIDLLSRKQIVKESPVTKFSSEIQWGFGPGAIRLEVNPDYSVNIERLMYDKQGNHRWIMKRNFQLNRLGYGGHEERVAEEIFETVQEIAKQKLDGPADKFEGLEDIVLHVYEKINQHAKPIFIPEGVKKLSDEAYIIRLGVRGQGVEAPTGQRVEQNQTMFAFDSEQGTLHVFNYNIESGTAKEHSWKQQPIDYDAYFAPNQTRDEIASAIIPHFRYY